jgi:hypothetical protein
MEPEVRDFLKRIVASLSLGFGWLLVNMTLGIYFEGLVVAGRPGIWNIFCYIFLAASLWMYLRYVIRTWKKKFPHG